MATVVDVARYILEQPGFESMTTMKLQKLVYYCQAWSLAWEGEPLFNEDFQAWANGPVSSKLFSYHKGKFRISSADIGPADPDLFSEEQKETMQVVLAYYGEKSPQWLVDLTHQEQPWILARKGVPVGEPCSKIITKDSMQEYYGGLI